MSFFQPAPEREDVPLRGNDRDDASPRQVVRVGSNEPASDWRVVLADCLGPEGLATLPDKSVDHVITDPPYDRSHTHQRRIANPRTGEVRAAPIATFDALTPEVMAAAAREFARVSRRWVLAFCEMEQTGPWREALVAAGARYIRTMVWVKPNGQPQLTGDRPGVGYECIVVAHSQNRTRWNGGGKRGWLKHCVDANFSREPRVHETQKPLPLMEELVRDFTDEGETVLDPFAGSGTTGVACRRLGRRFIGFEKDPRYAEIARKRIDGAREQMRMFEGSGT